MSLLKCSIRARQALLQAPGGCGLTGKKAPPALSSVSLPHFWAQLSPHLSALSSVSPLHPSLSSLTSLQFLPQATLIPSPQGLALAVPSAWNTLPQTPHGPPSLHSSVCLLRGLFSEKLPHRYSHTHCPWALSCFICVCFLVLFAM